MQRIKWAILCSGWGNNVIDVIDKHSRLNKLSKKIDIVLLIHDSEQCGAVSIAEKNNIETLKISRADFKTSKTHQQKVITELKERHVDYIFLMNYKFLIKQEMLDHFPNRIINIHPSLFPSFLATKSAIQDALAYGVKITGITTHVIDDKYDRGIILFQVPIKIKNDDNFDTLYPKFKKKGAKIILKTMLHVSRSENI